MDPDDLELPDEIVEALTGPSPAKKPSATLPLSEKNPIVKKPSLRGGFFSPAASQDLSKAGETSSVHSKSFLESTLISYPLESNKTCRHCSSIELDEILLQHFGVRVCNNCRQTYGDDYYKLITKTTAREEFLLTDEELADTTILPFMTKANPHKSTWSDMHLYLLGDVRNYAIKKWGSLEALNEELTRRDSAREARKEKKFKAKLSDLRKRTRSAAINKSLNKPRAHHKHVFHDDGGASSLTKKCTVCGLEIEQEEI